MSNSKESDKIFKIQINLFNKNKNSLKMKFNKKYFAIKSLKDCHENEEY